MTNEEKKDTPLMYLSNLRGTELIVQGSTRPNWTISHQLIHALIVMSDEYDRIIHLRDTFQEFRFYLVLGLLHDRDRILRDLWGLRWRQTIHDSYQH